MNDINEQLQRILEEFLDGEFQFNPIGHHELGRHYVFCLKDSYNKEYILKIYGTENRWYKEITALNLLKRDIPCPQIIKKGKLDNGVEWILMNKMPGVILEKVWDKISITNRKAILEELGEILSKMHNNSSYNYFGPWKDGCNNLSNHNDFLEYRKEKDKVIIDDILKQELPNKELLIKAYNEMKKFYKKFDFECSSCICHHDFSPRNTLVTNYYGVWKVSGIIDFEHCYPNDPYIDFTDLYQTIFIETPEYEKDFLKGYCKDRTLTENFRERVRYYLFNKGLLICSWSYNRANDYYFKGVNLLERLMRK